MDILALEPYYTGSHRAFLDDWSEHSRHRWTILGLPGYKWKWRMRHAALTFAGRVQEELSGGGHFDLIFCTDMLNLPEFRGLAGARVARLPAVAYFHENQLTYPGSLADERDYHFAMTNLITAFAADSVWFNSQFHRQSFLDAGASFLERMPDYRHRELIPEIEAKAVVYPQGIRPLKQRAAERLSGPLRILWAARWERDKDPDTFFEAISRLERSGAEFRLSLLGEQFEFVPEVFRRAREDFAHCIDHWGYAESRREYEGVLSTADVIVSTALHEFFGVSVVEAVAAGAFPLVPRRLAYPEILGSANTDEFFYDGSPAQLAERLLTLTRRLDQNGTVWVEHTPSPASDMNRFTWPCLAPVLDNAIESLA